MLMAQVRNAKATPEHFAGSGVIKKHTDNIISIDKLYIYNRVSLLFIKLDAAMVQSSLQPYQTQQQVRCNPVEEVERGERKRTETQNRSNTAP